MIEKKKNFVLIQDVSETAAKRDVPNLKNCSRYDSSGYDLLMFTYDLDMFTFIALKSIKKS